MIRLIQRRLIIPRGDTGSFTIPYLRTKSEGDVAVFTIFDCLTHTKMYQKVIAAEGDVLNIAFTHNDTVNLKPGKYLWDIKFYANPQFLDDELVNGDEVDSYYAGYSLPQCEIRETADNYLISPDAPSATLSPTQLDIITHAIESLNDAIEKTQENVEHYPEIRDEIWYVWDAELGDFVSTGVRANGIVGNGIESAVLNDDYTLTLNFTDGTSFTSSSIRGETGNGIDDIVLNNDFTLTISYTDGESYTTPSIRGPVGATPQFSIGTVQDGAVAAASITGTAENPVLNLTLPNAHVPTKVSQLENDSGYLTTETDPTVPQWAKEPTKPSYTPQEVGALPADTYIPQKTSDLTNDSDYAVDANYVHTDNNYTTAEKNKLSGIAAGAEVNVNADWNAVSGDAQILNKPTKVSDFTNDAGYLTTETDPTVPAWAKAANKPSYTAAEVGAPTVTEMNTAIREAIGQINSFDIAIVQALPTQNISTHTIYLVPKTGETNDVYDEYIYINSKWEMVGNTQIDLSDYALKDELPTKVSDLNNDSGYLTSYTETDPTVPAWAKASTKPAYTASEVGALPSNTHIPSTTAELTNDAGFITSADLPTKVSDLTNDAGYLTQHQDISGKANSADLAAVAISGSYDDLINKPSIPSKASDLTDDSGHYTKPSGGIPASDLAAGIIPTVPVQDVQVNGVSVLSDGVANVPIGGVGTFGVFKLDTNVGITKSGSGYLMTASAGAGAIKSGIQEYNPITPAQQHNSAFYGLAKAAGADMKDISSTTVGVYPEAQKSAISQMLNGSVAVTGTAPSITALPGIEYICGEVFTLDISLPESGCIDVTFDSGATPTVLTITPSTGQTLRWANGFDPTSLDANTTYEINIENGLGVAASWT